MAVVTPHARLPEMLKAEARLITNAAVGVGNVPTLDELLRRTQTLLSDEYDWPHLIMVTRKTLQYGQQYLMQMRARTISGNAPHGETEVTRWSNTVTVTVTVVA